ncbi:MAG TPA: methyl-accepting chemotaxis protein, partial [Nitrososphaera sp.]|nr:methyl-accepting chemotaxis protein [Nitrososphaera sp.]
ENSTEQVNTAVQQISTTIQQIAMGAQQQAGEIEAISRLNEGLASNAKTLASKASRAAEFSASVGTMSAAGSHSAAEAAEKIARIIDISHDSASNIRSLADRCSKINSVLDVIRKIAAKTNLLALNAAIEAARAGEAGKGFAVVADEVKGLAEGSAKSSEEIERIIKQVQSDAQVTVAGIEEGLKEISEGKIVIQRALHSLEDIAKRVNMVDAAVKVISVSARDQVASIEEVSKRAADIAAVSEQNAAATEQCASATEEESAAMQQITNAIHDLSTLGSQLEAILSKYRIGDTSGDSPSFKKDLATVSDDKIILAGSTIEGKPGTATGVTSA